MNELVEVKPGGLLIGEILMNSKKMILLKKMANLSSVIPKADHGEIFHHIDNKKERLVVIGPNQVALLKARNLRLIKVLPLAQERWMQAILQRRRLIVIHER